MVIDRPLDRLVIAFVIWWLGRGIALSVHGHGYNTVGTV